MNRELQHIAAGWAAVHIIEPDRRFQLWDHDKVAKAKGGAVYIDVEPDGRITIHKGLLPRKDAQRALGMTGTSRDDDSGDPVRVERPEMSAPLANYVDLVRHSAVRLAVADAPRIALRLMLAHVIGGGRWWRVEGEPQRPATEDIGAAVAALTSQAAFTVRRQDVMTLLALDDTETSIVRHDHDGARTATVFARLLELPDRQVMRIVAVVMAETLAAGTALIDTLGATLGVDMSRHWQPDDTFFPLVKDREAVSAMLAEVIGETTAATYLTDSGARKKALIRKALAGNGRAKVATWTPKPMAFPQAHYTARPLTAAAVAFA